MSEQQETSTKKLAELKAYLERKVAEHEEEIKTLRSFLEIVDVLLAEKSYRRLELPRSTIETAARRTLREAPQTVRTMSGVHLADLYVQGPDLRIVPSPNIKFDVNAAPFHSFLLGKVLDPMVTKDIEAVRKQELSADRVLSYKLDQEENLLKELAVKNYGDERRLNEIKNAVRWAFRKVYERTIGT